MVLVNHNGARCLRPRLHALASGTSEPRVEYVVVDSGSTDGSWQGIENGARVVRFEDNIGFCAGCNRGAEAAARAAARVRELRRARRAGLGRAAA